MSQQHRPGPRSLAEPDAIDELINRLGKLHQERPRAWGRMTAHETLCHLADSFRSVLGERAVAPAETWLQRTVIKYIALHTSLAWPHGVQTRPENDQQIGGTRPAEFARDRADVIDLMRRFALPGTRYARHPTFGELTREEWMIWAYRHMDHHLRQFAV
jgi:hypothetical protein